MYDSLKNEVTYLIVHNTWDKYLESHDYSLLVREKGPQLDTRLMWVLKESVCLLVACYCFFWNGNLDHRNNWYNLTLFSMYALHHANRSFLFPIQIVDTKSMPISITLGSALLNSLNAFLQGTYLGSLAPLYSESEFLTFHFILGSVLFCVGWSINNHSDMILQRLRRPGEKTYRIPLGGFFNYVSAANYFGELLEWLGFAIAEWSLPGIILLAFAVANLVPRAYHYHVWYHKGFGERYPKFRKILIPYLW
eukprot:TRINITY_DN4920_c0_g1_i1.p1 TRINITY_DN4920_c0_g1~~TRINITY_DN4920_c0_g1_i1.p1  ORF type:complete len:251 (-),score=43.74 TRINITY_DN4920_c0_g1_i1:309-1061(-)